MEAKSVSPMRGLDECQSQSANGLTLPLEWAHQEDSKDTPQLMCALSQVPFAVV